MVQIVKNKDMSVSNDNTDRRTEMIQELSEKLETGLKDLIDSDNYRKYLETISRFHNYSYRNCLLINAQCPHATHIAGYNDWRKKFHRFVKAGEKCIWIFAPAPAKRKVLVDRKDSITGDLVMGSDGNPIKDIVEIIQMFYKPVPCFDISQTDGVPLPEIVHKLDFEVDGYDRLMDAIKKISPVPISFENIYTNANGYYDISNNRIVVRNDLSEAQSVKTALHEIAHSMMHDKDSIVDKSWVREIEAESVAFIVCSYVGIDTADYSFGYITGWADGRLEDFKASLGRIKDTSSNIIDRLNVELSIEMPLSELVNEAERPVHQISI